LGDVIDAGQRGFPALTDPIKRFAKLISPTAAVKHPDIVGAR
jgi:hypothetical protein